MQKILLAAPTSDYKDYIFLDWYIHASNLTFDNYEILIVDNSHDQQYSENLKKMGINCLYVNPQGKKAKDFVCESQNIIRDYFLAGDYTHLFSLEVDVFPPRNIIEKLLCHDLKLISAPYFYDHGQKSNVLLQYFKKTDEGFKTYQPNFTEAVAFFDGKVKQVYENGIGCTLIQRSVIEKIKFRIDPQYDAFSDTPFYIDLYNNHIPAFLDTSIICRHYNSDWYINIDAA